MKKIFLPLSLLYRLFSCAHKRLFFREKIHLKSSRLLIVGSFRAGGAGKTPFSAYLAEKFLARGKSMAVLLHSFADDEFLWWKRRFSKKSLQIFQTKNRAKLAKVLDGKFDIILCDDGLEDKRLSESETILLDWGDSARKISDLIPCGKCRSLERDYSDFTFRLSCFGETPDVSFFISSIKPYSIWEKNLPEESSLNEKLSSKKIIAACGIGEPARFALDLKKAGYEVVKEIFSFDHSPYLAQILRKELRHRELPLVITEKDAVRIREKFSSMEKEKLARVFVALQEVSVSSKISEQIFSFTP